MDEKYIQDLYDHLGGQQKFGKFDDFKELISSDSSYRKTFYDSFGEKQLGAYDDFDSLVKKKGQDGSSVSATPLENTSSNTPNPETEIPIVSLEDNEKTNPIDLAAQYNELKNKTVEGVQGGSTFAIGSTSSLHDEASIKKANDLKEFLKINRGVDADELYNETKDLAPNDFGRKGFSKEELLADREENNQVYQRKLGRLKWQSGLEKSLADHLVNGDIKKEDYDAINGAIQSSLNSVDVGDFEQQRKNISTISGAIKNFGGADKDNLLSNYAIEVAKIYGNSYKNGGVKPESNSPESKYLTDPNEELAYQYIKDVAPEKAAQYERLFVDPKSLKNDPDAVKGYNHLKQTLEETGIALQQNAVNEDLNNLSRIASKNGGLNEEQIKQAEELQKKNDELAKSRTELDSKYPDRVTDKIDDATNEILGSRLGWGSYAAGKAGLAFKNTGKGIWEAVSSPFMSDESNKLRELAIMGEQNFDESVYRKSDANKAYQTDKLVIQPELQKQIDAIVDDKSLTREQKEDKLYPLLKNNTDKFGRVPVSGGKFNINPSSILYGVTDIGAAILPFVAAEVATGGVGGAGAGAAFLRTFTAAAATTFHDEYASAIAAGKPQSEAYKMAMINTAIGSAAMAGAGTAGKVREMIGGNTSAGQLIKGMSDEAIEAVIQKGTPKGLKAVGSAIKERLKATPKMLIEGAKTGAQFEGAMTIANELKAKINNTPIDREQAFKQSLLNIANFGFLGLLGHVGYKSPTEMQKSTILDFGRKPEEFRATLEKMKGQLSPTEYQHRLDLIDRSEEAVKTLPKSNAKGKELSPKEKADYLYNTVIKNEANKSRSTLPPKQAAEAEHTAMVADGKMDIIISDPTDKQLESQQSSLEKKLEPKKDAEGKVEELPEKEKASIEAELEAVKQTIEARQKEITETPKGEPENISQPIELNVEPENKPIQKEPIKEGVESTQPVATETKVGAEGSPVENVEPAAAGEEDGIKKPTTEQPVIFSEPKRTVFSHRGLQEVATEFGLNDITSRERVSDLRLFKGADETINDWVKEGSYKKNIDGLIEKAKAGEIFSPEQNVIMAQHIAQMREQAKQARIKYGINSPEYNEQLKQLQDITTVGQKVRSDIGAALRVPTLSRTYMPTLEDAMTAKMEANGTEVLTEKQKADVEKEFEKINKAREEAEKNWKDADARFREMQAENELLKQQQSSKSKIKTGASKTGKRDYQAERKSYKDELKSLVEDYKAAGQKLGVTADGGAESFVITAKMAKAIMKIVGSHLEETGAKLAEVTKKTYDDIKDLFDGITEADVHDVIAGKYNEKRGTLSELTIKKKELQTEAKLLNEYNRLLQGGEPKSEKKAIARNARLTELRKEIKGLEDIDKEVEGVKDAALQAKIDKNKQIVSELDKLEKKDKAAAAKKRREVEAQNAKELQRLKEEFDKKLRENERKNKEDAIDLQRKLKEQANEKQRQMDKDAAEFGKKLRDEELKRKQDEIDLAKELKRKLEYKTPAERVAAQAIKRNDDARAKIEERLKSKDFEAASKPETFMESASFKKNHPELYKKVLDSYNAKQDAQHDFDVALLKDSQEKRYRIVPGKNKFGTLLNAAKVGKNMVIDFAGAAANTTKKVVTGVDDSSLFMQTLAAMSARPLVAIKALKLHALDAVSQKRFDRNLAELHNSPDWDLMQKSGLDVTEPKSLSQLNREEAFSGKTLDLSIKVKGEKHKVLETLLSPFERAFTSLGNGMRVIAFRTLAEKYMSEGKTFDNDPQLYKDLALMLNTETGRGKQNEYIQKASELVTKGIWSPRLMASRLNMLGISDAASILLHKAGTKGYYSQLHPEIRKEAIKDLVKFSSTVLALSYLAAWKFGGTVDDDPRSQTFLDIKMPSGKSYNISGGFSQYIRAVAQTASGGISKNGVYQPFNGQKEGGSNLLHFMRGKVTPVAGVGIDVLTGKDFSGQPITIGSEAAKLGVPLSLQGVANDVKKDGLTALYNATLPSFVGITVKDERDYTAHKFSDEANKFLQDNQIPIKMPNKKYVKDGKEVDMSEEDYKKYLKRVDERIDHDIKQLKQNGVIEGGNVKDAVTKIVSDAQRTAKEELFGFQYKEPELPSFINNYSPMPAEIKNQ